MTSMGELLSNATPGDEGTVGKLLPLVYAELKALAGSYLAAGGAGGGAGGRAHTLQPTALVHEAYLKLMSKDRQWAGRDHFIATAARAMRQVLVDHARGKGREKRGGGMAREVLTIETVADGRGARALRVLELDELLEQLAKADERAARVAEMRLFGGMEQEQIARVLGVSRMTVTTDWQFARAFLASEFGGAGDA